MTTNTDTLLTEAADRIKRNFLDELADAPIIDTTVTCPACGHDEAVIGDPAPGGGFNETCCNPECGVGFIDPTE